MGKTSIKYKEVKLLIEKKLQEGMSKKEVLEDLSETYYDKNTLSKMIAGTPSPEAKIKFKTLNNVLLGLLILTIGLKLLLGILIFRDASPIFVFVLFLMPLLNVYFALKISKFDGFHYGFLVLFVGYSLFRSLSNIGESPEGFLVDLLIGGAIIGLALYLKTNMFPHLGFLGPKKGADGAYLLGE